MPPAPSALALLSALVAAGIVGRELLVQVKEWHARPGAPASWSLEIRGIGSALFRAFFDFGADCRAYTIYMMRRFRRRIVRMLRQLSRIIPVRTSPALVPQSAQTGGSGGAVPAPTIKSSGVNAALVGTTATMAVAQGGTLAVTGHGLVITVTGHCFGTGALAVGVASAGFVCTPVAVYGVYRGVRWVFNR